MDDDFRKKFALQKGNYMILKHLLIQKLDILSFFDKIFLFFFYSSKIIPTFAYRKTINIYRIQTQTNTIIYTQTCTIMKRHSQKDSGSRNHRCIDDIDSHKCKHKRNPLKLSIPTFKIHTLWDALSNYYCISSLTN